VATIKVVDKGFSAYHQAVKELHGSAVQVGIFAEVGDKVLTKAIVNEFGTTQAGKKRNVTIPERSFIRSTYNKQYKKVSKRFGQIFYSFAERKYDVKRRLKLIGQEQVSETQKTITNFKTPANAPSTIQKKGSSHPLIDTGELRSKITYKTVKK
jgi:hypothetical protein